MIVLLQEPPEAAKGSAAVTARPSGLRMYHQYELGNEPLLPEFNGRLPWYVGAGRDTTHTGEGRRMNGSLCVPNVLSVPRLRPEKPARFRWPGLVFAQVFSMSRSGVGSRLKSRTYPLRQGLSAQMVPSFRLYAAQP